MFEDDFSKMLRDYPAAVTDKKVFAGLMKDLFPGQQMQINLMNTTYELGIANEIAGVAHINNAFAFRFVKRLVDEYGVSRLNADWAVSVWCVCYGQRLLHKPCDIQISRSGNSGRPPSGRRQAIWGLVPLYKGGRRLWCHRIFWSKQENHHFLEPI